MMQHFPHGIGLKFLDSKIPSTCGVNMTNLGLISANAYVLNMPLCSSCTSHLLFF